MPTARCGTVSARHAAKNAPAGGISFSRSSAKSQSSLRASSFAPPPSWAYAGVLRLRHATASKNQNVVNDDALYAESMQWLAV